MTVAVPLISAKEFVSNFRNLSRRFVLCRSIKLRANFIIGKHCFRCGRTTWCFLLPIAIPRVDIEVLRSVNEIQGGGWLGWVDGRVKRTREFRRRRYYRSSLKNVRLQWIDDDEWSFAERNDEKFPFDECEEAAEIIGKSEKKNRYYHIEQC